MGRAGSLPELGVSCDLTLLSTPPPPSTDHVVHTTQTKSLLSSRCQVVDIPLQSVHHPIDSPNSRIETISETVPSNSHLGNRVCSLNDTIVSYDYDDTNNSSNRSLYKHK